MRKLKFVRRGRTREETKIPVARRSVIFTLKEDVLPPSFFFSSLPFFLFLFFFPPPPLPSLFIRTNILFNGTRPARLSRPFDIAVSLHKTRGLHKTGGQAFLEQHRSERQGLGCLGWKGSQLKKKKKKTSSGLSATLQLHAERIRISLSLSLFYFHRDNNLMIHRTL